jgi:RNA-directed DNA polymerase
VSAVSASPAAKGPVRGVPADPVRALQHALYRAAKAGPGRRFHALYDKVCRSDVLWRARVAVRADNGAPGIGKVTLAQVEEYGVARLPGELAGELREGRYRPLPARRVLIPKPGTKEQRPLSIPPVRGRIVQAAVKIVPGPVFEADFLPVSFGFRPGRPAHGALQVLIDECWRGRRWVAETDIASCFSAVPHDKLMQAVEERVCDQPVLKLLRVILRAGVTEDGQLRRPVAGTPQGGVISPVMCNVYLHRLDRAWDESDGVLARYADDLVVMCWSRSQAEQALERLTGLLADLGLEPKAAKTRIVHLEAEREEASDVPCPLARGQGGAARPRPDQGTDPPVADAAAGEVDRGGPEPVPGRLGRLLPVRQLRCPLREDQELCPDAAGAVHQQAPPPFPGVRLVGSHLPVPESARAGHLVGNRR